MTGLAALWHDASSNAGNECKARRERVLRHPDLAQRLITELGYAHPGQWNGYVPPHMVNLGLEEVLHNERAVNARHLRTEGAIVNDSPRRAILVSIAAEALRRERETAETPSQKG